MNGVLEKMKGVSITGRVFKRIIAVAVILGIAGTLLVYGFKKVRSAKVTEVKQQTAVVRRGSFGVSVSGSGPLAAAEKSDVSAKAAGTVTKIYFKEGDTVKAGELMYELDDSTARLNVEKARVNLAQMQLTQKNDESNLGKLSITAPFSGQATNVTLKQGDAVSKGGSILTLTDRSKLKITLSFNSSQMEEITQGQKAVVNIQNLMQSVEGTVTYVNNALFSTSTGGELFNVEIVIDNPGSINEGMTANAEINTSKGAVSSTGSGTLSYVNSQNIKSDVAGTVGKVNVKEGQYIKEGELLVQLTSDDLLLAKESNDVKAVEQRAQLESAEKELENYKVYAPIDGVIIKQNAREGNTVKSGDALASISNSTVMECAIPIDELDIAKIKVGQKASVIVDALPETSSKPLEGEVSKIAPEGTSSNGVANYPVTIRINNAGGLRSGMNVNAEISIEERKDVLYLPIQAVQKIQGRTFVMVEGDGTNNNTTQENQSRARNYADGNSQGTGAAGNARPNSGETGNPQAGGYAAGGNGGGRIRGNTAQSQGQPSGTPGSGTAPGAGRSASDGGTADGGGMSGNISVPAARTNPEMAKYYANIVMKPVEVGINNESYIEIISGLSENEAVILPPTSTSTSNSSARGTTGANPLSGLGGGGFMGGGSRPVQGGTR